MIATLALLPSFAASQSRDTTAATRASEQRRERLRSGQEGFRDENGNGIDDRIERQSGSGSSRKDKFVDADGDGICDGRAAGLGFKRGPLNGQQGAATGKGSGSGNRYGQGGKK
jgi:hypothetical protein